VGRELPDLQALGKLAGRRVLVRADLNVPMADGAVSDDTRIRASLPTIRKLADAGARVVVCSHLGRPKGAPDPKLSLAPVAARLAELLGRPVAFAADVTGESAHTVVAGLADGAVALLENLRFDPRETADDPGFAAELASLADCYVDDAFGAVHRAHASVSAVARLLPHAAGDLVRSEVAALDRLRRDPAHPYVVVLGGAKVSDKLALLEALLDPVDRLLIGGGMCFTFLQAAGAQVGDSLVEVDQLDSCRRIVQLAGQRDVTLLLPLDVVVAEQVSADAATKVTPAEHIPDGYRGLDIGPRTAELFREKLADARTVFWNGPMGVAELPQFREGTRAVATAMAQSAATSVVGGGDSAAAIHALGMSPDSFTHVSTGGGASLEYLEGKSLPGLAVLTER
jgi:phosphoglycerate kinase